MIRRHCVRRNIGVLHIVYVGWHHSKVADRWWIFTPLTAVFLQNSSVDHQQSYFCLNTKHDFWWFLKNWLFLLKNCPFSEVTVTIRFRKKFSNSWKKSISVGKKYWICWSKFQLSWKKLKFSYFLLAVVVTLLVSLGLEKDTSFKRNSLLKHSILRILTLRKCQKNAISSEFPWSCKQKYRVKFLHLGFNWKQSAFKRLVHWKSIVLVSCTRILINR